MTSVRHLLMSARGGLGIVLFMGWVLGAVELGGIQAQAMEPPDKERAAAAPTDPSYKDRLDFVTKLGNHKVDTFKLKKAITSRQRAFLQSQGRSMEDVNRLAPVPAPPPDWQGMPSTGNVKILAILIEFKDLVHTNSQADIHTNLFGNGNPARAPYESLAKYYSRASYNKLNLSNGNTLGWYKTTYDRSAVPQTTVGRENLIKEALNSFNSQGHDFAQYDNNGDGTIDYLVVIWTGPDTGWGTFWWGYQTSFSDSNYKLDGKKLGRYSWQWEARPVGSTFSPVVVIHETGHALGLPDFYDYDPAQGPKGGVGGLDMMDANKGDHNCFSKWMLEWINPAVIASGTHNKSLGASGTSQDCVIIWPGITSSNLFSEFFVAQNRHRVGNDNAPGMPADGMTIWHVDAHLTPNGRDFQYDNSFTSHKLIRLMEADGLEQIESGSAAADAGDYYVTGKNFGPATTPNSKKYDGSDSSVEITDLSAAGPQMAATFKIGGASPPSSAVLAFGVVLSNGAKASGTPNWTSTYNATYSRYEIAITGENYYYLNYATVVTPTGDTRFCRTSSVGGKLLVYCHDKTGNPATARFAFVTHK